MNPINLTFIGDSTVGKSSIIYRLYKNTFDENMRSTIGAALINYKNPDYNIDVTIWDTAGQERYDCLVPSYLRKAHIIALTIDISNYSFIKIKKQLDKHINTIKKTISEFSLIVLLNKCDLVNPLEYDNIIKNVNTLLAYYDLEEGIITGDNCIIVSARFGIGFSTLNTKISTLSNLIKQNQFIKMMNKENGVSVFAVEGDKKSYCYC